MQINSYEQKIYLPDRLISEISRIPNCPLTLIEAPSGFGKTTSVREYLNENMSTGIRQFWYTCLSKNPLVSWAGICDLFSNIDIEMSKNLEKLGLPIAETLLYVSACFKEFRCVHETYLVVDNFHLLKSDVLQDLIYILSSHGNPNLHIILITQPIGMKANKSFHNTNVYSIESSAFFFDKESTARLFKLEGIRLGDDMLNSVYASTEGWISAIRLQISNYRQTGSFDFSSDIDHLVENAIWNRLTPDEKTCLVSLSVLDSFTARQVAIMLGVETLPDNIRALLRHNDFIRYFAREKIYVMHSILQNYLRDQFYQYESEAFQKRVLLTAGECCIVESDLYTAARFFFEVRDFDALLSIPFTGKYLINKRDSDIIIFLKQVVRDCPEEIMCKYPFVLLIFSYLLRLDGEYEYYYKLCRLIDLVLKSNPAGLGKDELRQLKGEYLLLTSLISYNDIHKVHEGQKAAFELLGGPSRFNLIEIPITLGGTSVMSMFWREPGKLDETLNDLQKNLPYHVKLAHGQGAGADSALQAEMLLVRGDDVQAEILCHKALYQARSKRDTCICLCAEQILARIAIFRGDVEGFFTSLENIKSYAKESSNLYILRMVDVCLSAISVTLDITDMVAKWLFDVESKNVYARAVPYVNILYSHLLYREKRHAELLGLLDNTVSLSKDMRYILPQVYCYIFMARVLSERGNEHAALESLEKALSLACPDRVYLPFAQFLYIGDLLSKARSSEAIMSNKELKGAIKNITELYVRYHKGKNAILNALNHSKSPLTPREREVAILAKSRLTNQEIADRLFISKATVRTILYNAYNKLGIHSRSELYSLEF